MAHSSAETMQKDTLIDNTPEKMLLPYEEEYNETVGMGRKSVC